MNKVEIKILAQKIAQAEKVIQNSNDKGEIKKAKEDIVSLTSSVKSLSDLFALDEEILKYFENN